MDDKIGSLTVDIRTFKVGEQSTTKRKILNELGEVVGEIDCSIQLLSHRIQIDVLQAQGLRADDAGFMSSSSDPYAEVRHGFQLGKTETISCSLSPSWNASFLMSCLSDCPVDIDIYDSDMMGSDNRLGKVNIPLKKSLFSLKGRNVDWFELADKKTPGESCGKVQIGLTISEVEYLNWPPPPDDGLPVVKQLGDCSDMVSSEVKDLIQRTTSLHDQLDKARRAADSVPLLQQQLEEMKKIGVENEMLRKECLHLRKSRGGEDGFDQAESPSSRAARAAAVGLGGGSGGVDLFEEELLEVQALRDQYAALSATRNREAAAKREEIDELKAELEETKARENRLKKSLKEEELQRKLLQKQVDQRLPKGTKDAGQIEVLTKRVAALVKDRKEKMDTLKKCTCGAAKSARPATSPSLDREDAVEKNEKPRSKSPFAQVSSRVFASKPGTGGPAGGGGGAMPLTRREEIKLKNAEENSRRPRAARAAPEPQKVRLSATVQGRAPDPHRLKPRATT